MYQNVLVIFVLVILSRKVYEIAAKSLHNKNEAYRQARTTKQPSNSSVTSYYQHDPYGPNTYAFGFEVNDKRTGNVQFRDERRYLNGSTSGSFGYLRPDGRVTVTRFLSDKQNGYLSFTETFEPGEEHKWIEHWPTKKPTIILERPANEFQPSVNVSYYETHHLNKTGEKLPAHVANALKEQHGFDVGMKTVDLENDLLNPAIDAIINGKIPLQQQTNKKGENGAVGYETVHNFIPPEFPIVPFKLPTKEKEVEELKQDRQTKTENKYVKAKMNNAEKAVNAESLNHHTNVDVRTEAVVTAAATMPPTTEIVIAKGSVQELNELDKNNESTLNERTRTQLPKPATLNEAEGTGNQLWYEKLINDTRREFLQNIPNLT